MRLSDESTGTQKRSLPMSYRHVKLRIYGEDNKAINHVNSQFYVDFSTP